MWMVVEVLVKREERKRDGSDLPEENQETSHDVESSVKGKKWELEG